MLCFLVLLWVIDGLSQNYQIPSYYGSRDKDFLLYGNVIQGHLRSFYWFSRVHQWDGYYLYSDPINHKILNVTQGSIELIAGIQGSNGYRDGDFFNTLFNRPSGLIYVRLSERQRQQEISKKTIVLINNSTECLQCDQFNYTKCEYIDQTESLNVQSNYISYHNVSLQLIKDIYFLNETFESEISNQYGPRIILVADQGNHCIRKLDLQAQTSSTVAGICGQKGFKDGRLGVSLLNEPTNIGVDALGTVFFYDSGNVYLRIIDTDGNVKTLLNGACRDDVRYSPLEYQTHLVHKILCYVNWIKTSGQPDQHILTKEDDIYVCTEHYTDCP